MKITGLSLAAEDVVQFMLAGHPENIVSSPTIPLANVRELCQTLLRGELLELSTAIVNDDLNEIADGIGDSIFVLLYMAHCYGLPIGAIWDEIVRTNMTKFVDGVAVRDPHTNKILKPESWMPPDIEAILAAAIPRTKMYCPNCGKQHVDEGRFARHPHRTHRCVDDAAGRGCGREWIVLPYAFGAKL